MNLKEFMCSDSQKNTNYFHLHFSHLFRPLCNTLLYTWTCMASKYVTLTIILFMDILLKNLGRNSPFHILLKDVTNDISHIFHSIICLPKIIKLKEV